MKDAIIVLGGGVNHSGSLRKITDQRLEKAYKLYKKGAAKAFITSGLWGITEISTHLEAEAESMGEKLVKLGVPSDQIFEEVKSRDTIENAFFTKILYLDPNKWKDIIVVTSDFHLARTEYIFKKVLGNDYTVEFVGAKSDVSPEKAKQTEVREIELLKYDKKCLSMLKAGDEKELRRILFYNHPLYQSSETTRS